MQAAEAKTLRENLGLPVSWLAVQANVQERTVRYWESGQTAIPRDVADLLIKIDNMLDEESRHAMAIISSKQSRSALIHRFRTDEELALFRPDFCSPVSRSSLPATCHAAMLARLRRDVLQHNLVLEIKWFSMEEYEGWLGNRMDAAELRSRFLLQT